ncbi:MAG: hypothetical protein IPH11_03770 [Ignavibacteriales bacterium]|nr:hypothetical protein [Ignavibacteriales bacterium]
MSCVNVSTSCGHIDEGLGDEYAEFLHIYRRLVDKYARTEDDSGEP